MIVLGVYWTPLVRWAAELKLLVTAGSDFHGATVQPGRHLGDRWLAADRFAALEQRAAALRASG